MFKGYRGLLVGAICALSAFSSAQTVILPDDGGAIVPPCGAGTAWYFGPIPFAETDTVPHSLGTFTQQAYYNGQEYGGETRSETWFHVKQVNVDGGTMPGGIYTVQLVVGRVSAYNPCTNVNSMYSNPMIIGGYTIANHNNYGGEGGSGAPYGLVSTYAKDLLQGGSDNVQGPEDNPLGDYQTYLQIDGVMGGASYNGTRIPIGDPIELRILAMSEDGQEILRCDNLGELCTGPGNGEGGGGTDTDYTPWWERMFDPEPDQAAKDRWEAVKQGFLDFLPIPLMERWRDAGASVSFSNHPYFDVPFSNPWSTEGEGTTLRIDMTPYASGITFTRFVVLIVMVWGFWHRIAAKAEDTVSQGNSGN